MTRLERRGYFRFVEGKEVLIDAFFLRRGEGAWCWQDGTSVPPPP